MSLITKARHDGLNYIFALLLGYREPPAGVEVVLGLIYQRLKEAMLELFLLLQQMEVKVVRSLCQKLERLAAEHLRF